LQTQVAVAVAVLDKVQLEAKQTLVAVLEVLVLLLFVIQHI
jgi:hypothetical protein